MPAPLREPVQERSTRRAPRVGEILRAFEREGRRRRRPTSRIIERKTERRGARAGG